MSPTATASPAFTAIPRTVPACAARISVSIFMASRSQQHLACGHRLAFAGQHLPDSAASRRSPGAPAPAGAAAAGAGLGTRPPSAGVRHRRPLTLSPRLCLPPPRCRRRRRQVFLLLPLAARLPACGTGSKAAGLWRFSGNFRPGCREQRHGGTSSMAFSASVMPFSCAWRLTSLPAAPAPA